MKIYDNQLVHFGTRGMKWGIRHTPEQLGRKKTMKVQRWVEDRLRTGNLTVNEIHHLESAREKTLLSHVLSTTSPEGKMLYSIDVIMDTVAPHNKKIPIASLHTTQTSNEILRLNDVYDNIQTALHSKDQITVVRYNGKNVLSNGNHRAIVLLKMGVQNIDTKYYDYDAYLSQKPGAK